MNHFSQKKIEKKIEKRYGLRERLTLNFACIYRYNNFQN